MSQQDSKVDNSFVMPDDARLQNLGPGCFVRVACQSQNKWVEITVMNGEEFQGVVHSELDVGGSTGVESQWRLDDINALGCDRYCFCE